MLEFIKRDYLQKIIYKEYLEYFNSSQAKWRTSIDLQNYDHLLLMKEDQLYTANTVDEINSYSEVFEIFDKSIRGTGKGIELEEVFIPKGNKYIGDMMSKMPLDVMIYKGKTGVGGTTLAIQDIRKWVICVGSRDLVKLKSKLHKNSLGVYAIGHGGASNNDILFYNGNTIFVTWSSLERLTETINVEEWSLLFDENQELVYEGSYRSKDINKALRLKDKFKHVTLISATEIKAFSYLGYFKGMDTLRFRWEVKKHIDITVEETSNLQNNIAQLAKTTLSDDDSPNLHIFVNSVEFIIKVVLIIEKVLDVDLSDKISIITANNSKNKERLKNIGTGKYEIEELESIKRINFYTSTCFSGVDIIDDNGDIIMAVNGKVSWTRLSLKIIEQITGRIRNPRKDMNIKLIFTRGDSRKIIPQDDYKKSFMDSFKDAKETVLWFNSLSEKGKVSPKNKNIIEERVELELVEGKAKVNRAYFMSKNSSYQKDNTLYIKIFTSDKQYVITQGDEIFTFNKEEDGLFISGEIFDANSTTIVKRGASFKTKMTDLLDDMDEKGWKKSWWTSDKDYYVKKRTKWCQGYINSNDSLFENRPFLKDAFLYFSPDDIREKGLKISNIKIAVGKQKGVSNLKQLRDVINIKVGVKYTSDEIKDVLGKAYDKIGLKKSNVATYIKEIIPNISYKNYPVDKEVEINHDEYWIIKRHNKDLPKMKQIHTKYVFDERKYYKTEKGGGRAKLYLLPF